MSDQAERPETQSGSARRGHPSKPACRERRVDACAFQPAARRDVLAAAPRKHSNCKALNKDYPHGVGRPGARDKTTGSPPVTNFAVRKRVYKLNQVLP